MNKKKYYIFSEINFDFLRQRHQILAQYISNDYQVIFIDRVVSRFPIDLHKRIIKSIFKDKSINEVESRIEIKNLKIKKSILLPSINSVFNIYNVLRCKYLLRNAKKDDIVHVFANHTAVISEAKRKNCFVIFDLIHNWWEFPYHTEKQRKNINQNLSKSDLIITDSEITLGILKSKKIECKKLYLPPGVDAIWFERGENKYCNESRKKRSIAFFGNLRANSDTNLLDKIVENSSLDLEIYGLLDPSLGKENIIKFQKYYFGKLSVDKLVDKLNRVDMILLPYDESSFSKSIFPAKYFEALALGKPIISNSNLYHLPGWEKIVWRSTDLDVLGVEKLISIHTMERAKMQIEIAEKNSWTNRVTVLKDAINESI